MEKKQYIQPKTEAFMMQIQPLMDPSRSEETIKSGFEEGAKDNDDTEIGFHNIWED